MAKKERKTEPSSKVEDSPEVPELSDDPLINPIDHMPIVNLIDDEEIPKVSQDSRSKAEALAKDIIVQPATEFVSHNCNDPNYGQLRLEERLSVNSSRSSTSENRPSTRSKQKVTKNSPAMHPLCAAKSTKSCPSKGSGTADLLFGSVRPQPALSSFLFRTKVAATQAQLHH